MTSEYEPSNYKSQNGRSFVSTNSNLTCQIRQKLREINKMKTNSISDGGGTGMCRDDIQDRDIEHLLYVYQDEFPIEV